MAIAETDRDEALIREAIAAHSKGRDWPAVRLDLAALHDRLLELGRDDYLPREDVCYVLHRATGEYLAHPDPAGWLLAADLIERTCDKVTCYCDDCEACKHKPEPMCPIRCPAKAAVWRARGKHYPPLMDACRRLLSGPRAFVEGVWVRIGDAVVDFKIRGSKTIDVQVEHVSDFIADHPVRKHPHGAAVWMIRDPENRYHTRRCIQLIDTHRDLLDGGK